MHALIDFPPAPSAPLAPPTPGASNPLNRERLAFPHPPSRWIVATDAGAVPAAIAAAEAAARQGAWVIGRVDYEAAPAFDRALIVRPAEGDAPVAAFAIFETDPVPWPATDAPPEADAPAGFRCGPWQADARPDAIAADIEALKAEIAAGRHYQTNLTMRLTCDFAGSGEALFHALNAAQPGGYGLYLDEGRRCVASVSPELFFDWQTDRLQTRPMKGTAPRAADPAADAAAAAAMQASDKERAENLMIVDLLRNDLARIATTGSVAVPALFAVEALPSVWQMTSTVTCTTRPGTGLADVFAALFPCGSITGAPKVTAMQAIAERERSPRGSYCGALGLIRPGGHATFNVAIRTVAVDLAAGRAVSGVGSGITIDSSAAAEVAEWQAKCRFLRRATAHFELLETFRLEAGNYVHLERHLRRLAQAADHFGFALAPDRIRRALADWAHRADAHRHGAWRMRLRISRDGRPTVEGQPLEPGSASVTVGLADTPVRSDDEFLRYKTTERSVYAAHPVPDGCFDVLLWNEREELTEFTKGNVIVELDGRRVTPPRHSGLLDGIGRQILLEQGEIVEAVVRRSDLARATGLWFVNGLRGCLPATLLKPAPDAPPDQR